MPAPAKKGHTAQYLERAAESRRLWRARTPLIFLGLGVLLLSGAFALRPLLLRMESEGDFPINLGWTHLWFLGGAGAGFLLGGAALRAAWAREEVAALAGTAGELTEGGIGPSWMPGFMRRRAGRQLAAAMFLVPVALCFQLPPPWSDRAGPAAAGLLMAGVFGFALALWLDPEFATLFFRPWDAGRARPRG